jgi:hypothetical protein
VEKGEESRRRGKGACLKLEILFPRVTSFCEPAKPSSLLMGTSFISEFEALTAKFHMQHSFKLDSKGAR